MKTQFPRNRKGRCQKSQLAAPQSTTPRLRRQDLKGTKPGKLPIEQLNNIALVVSRKALSGEIVLACSKRPLSGKLRARWKDGSWSTGALCQWQLSTPRCRSKAASRTSLRGHDGAVERVAQFLESAPRLLLAVHAAHWRHTCRVSLT